MNTTEFIESGVLELYVSGLLSIEEMRDVELRACQHPEIKTELETLQGALEQLAMKHAMTPRADVKEKIMRAISEYAGASLSHQQKPENISSMDDKEREGKIKPINRMQSNFSTLLIAASVALLGIMTALTFYFSGEYKKEKYEVAELQSQQHEIQKQVDNMQLSMMQSSDKIQLLTNASTMRIVMKGTDKSPSSMAMIYWNKDTKAVYLDIKTLPPVPDDKQYQLWFIDPKAGPVSAGVFELTNGEIVRMGSATDAAAFAVTLEPRGGSTQPTMDQMFVLGSVNS